MSFPNSRIYSRRHILEVLGLFLFSLVVLNPLNVSVGFLEPITAPGLLKESLLSLGQFGPFLMILLEALQVLIAPLPPVTMIASGYTFGFFYGSIYSFIGMTLGSTAAILISRRFGKPLVSRFISRDHMEKFHSITEKHGIAAFTVLFVAPGFPHDVLCYIAGLTDLDWRKLAISVSLGRLPTLLALVLTGEGIASSQLRQSLFILALLMITGVIAVKNQEKLIEHARKLRTEYQAL